MKLLLFSDLHADLAAARRLIDKTRSAEVVVAAGDMGNVRRDLRACVEVLREIDRPTVLVAGNNESTDELVAACSDWPHAHVLHGTKVTISGVEFFGLGGGVPVTPFGPWSYDFSEEQAAGLLENCPVGCVLVSHSPPKGCVDISSSGRSLGSTAVRDVVLKRRPIVVVCGHIHGSGGRDALLGNTPVVNAGPDGLLWSLAGGIIGSVSSA